MRVHTLFLVLLLIATTIWNCQAQKTIDYSSLGLMKADYNHRTVLYIGNSRRTASAVLGNPTSKTIYHSDIDEIDMNLWTYGSNKLYFASDKLVSYEINDPAIIVGKNFTNSMRVGGRFDNSGNYSGFTLITTPGSSRNYNYSAAAIAGLKTGTIEVEYGAEVLLNSSGIIFNIAVSENE